MAESLRALNMEARRQRILDTAAELIIHDGIDALNMRALGKEVGLSVTTLYNLYGSKEAIVSALQERLMSGIEDELQGLPWHIDPIARCRYVMTNPVEYMVKNKAFVKAIMSPQAQQYNDGQTQANLQARGAYMQETALKEAIRNGLIIDTIAPDILASHLYISWAATAARWIEGQISDEEFEARVDFALVIGIMPFAYSQLRKELEQELIQLEKRLTPFRIPQSIKDQVAS